MDIGNAGRLYTEFTSSSVSEKIHPNDHMYNSGPDWYFTVGESAVRSILGGLSMSWTKEVKRVMDLPCGHGRVARQLRRAFPNAEMYFCDIDKEGADFCAEEFNGRAIYSEPDLTVVDLPKDLDLIWIGSLFTHVDFERTEKWVRYLVDHLAPKGLLVATFHGAFTHQHFEQQPHHLGGASWEKIKSEYDETGYGYDRYSDETMGDYGISLSKASKIIDMANAIEGTRTISYTERGWGYNHDVLVLTRQDRLESF